MPRRGESLSRLYICEVSRMGEKFRVVCYTRVESDTSELLSWEEALREREILELMNPGDFYVIEEVKE